MCEVVDSQTFNGRNGPASLLRGWLMFVSVLLFLLSQAWAQAGGLSVPRRNLAAASSGDKIVFAGGKYVGSPFSA